MKVSAERVPPSQVVLQIEVEPERVEKSLNSAYQRLVRRTSVPGFRKGKAPRAMLERYLGHDTLFQEALDILIPEVYREALDQEDIDPIEYPHVEMVSTDPLVMKATVPVRPTVELGDYQGMWLPRDPVLVPEERVEEMVEELRHRYANFKPVDRPLQWSDAVRADVAITVDGRTVVNQKDADFRLREGMTLFVPGLAEKMPGLEKGTEKDFELALPGEFADKRLAGKTAHCRVLVHEIKEEELPALDDAFARQVGEGFANVAALRERLQNDLREAEEQAALDAYRDRVISTLEEGARLEYPAVLVEKEIDRMLRDQLGAGSDESALERYLQRVGKSEEQFRSDLRPAAEQRLRRSLLLSRVAEVENISVEDAEVDEELERMTSSAGPQAAQMRRLFDNPAGRDAIRGSLLTRKTWDRLVGIVSVDKAARSPDGDAGGESASDDSEAL